MSNLKLHYAPRTRSFTALWILEELGLPYELEAFDLNTGHQRTPEFMTINSLGKVPVVMDGSVAVPELGAIAIYLADKYGEGRLGPSLESEHRAAFLRWCFFASAIVEPALGEKFFKWDLPSGSVAWGSFERMIQALEVGLTGQDFLVDNSFTVADALVGSGLRFGLLFGAIGKGGFIESYVERLQAREAFKRASVIEARESIRFPAAKS